MIAGAGVSPDCLISSPCVVVGSAPRMAMACRLRRSWRSSCLPTSVGSHQSSLPYSATAWMHATWTALMALTNNPICLVKGSESSFCSPGFLHASVVLLLEHWVCAQPYSQPVCRLGVESYDPISDHHLCCQCRPEVFFVASSAREQRHLHLSSVELKPSLTCPLDAPHCTSRMYHDDVVDIAASRYPAKVVPKGLPFGFWFRLFDPFDQS